MTTVTMNISDIQRNLKDKILPMVEAGNEIIIEDAKTHEKKFRIVPVEKESVSWPDFLARAKGIAAAAPLADALNKDRERY